MARGRKPQPAAIKAIKDDSRKVQGKLAAVRGDAVPEPPPLEMSDVEVPEFLTSERSKMLFTRVIEDHVQNRIARGPDLSAYARWAYYLDKWIELKEETDKTKITYETRSKHGRLKRRHPSFNSMLEIEPMLVRLEDRLAINPAARQSYLRALAGLSGPLRDQMGPKGIGGRRSKKQQAAAEQEDFDPVGYMARAAGKENLN